MICRSLQPWFSGGERVLDVGCGNGLVSQVLKETLGLDLWGTDIQDYRKTEIPFTVMETPHALPFHETSFEAILFNDVLHHVQHSEPLLIEASRLTDQIFIFEDKESWLLKLVDIGLNKLYFADMPVPLTFKSSEEWISLFSKLGFQSQILPVHHPFWWPFTHLAFRITRHPDL